MTSLTSVAAGGIAGESIMGVMIAALIAFGIISRPSAGSSSDRGRRREAEDGQPLAAGVK